MKRIRWLAAIIVLTGLPAFAMAGVKNDSVKVLTLAYPKQGGNFSLGLRNTYSLFSEHTKSSYGAGVGGHFRLQVIDRVITEWFADVLITNIKNKAHRTDYHIGWSVMFYLINPRGFTRKLTPYAVTGHCFDFTSIKINGENGDKQSRFSSAIQAGLGCHYNVTPRFDISLAAQYMFHLGKELHAHEDEHGDMLIELEKNAGWEGHLLISISANYKIFKLWNRNQ